MTTVRVRIPSVLCGESGAVLQAGDYDAEVGQSGALFAMVAGRKFGLKPGEFEFVDYPTLKWPDIPWLFAEVEALTRSFRLLADACKSSEQDHQRIQAALIEAIRGLEGELYHRCVEPVVLLGVEHRERLQAAEARVAQLERVLANAVSAGSTESTKDARTDGAGACDPDAAPAPGEGVERPHCDRCDRCGYPDGPTSGCTPGKCCVRPLPDLRKTCAGCGEWFADVPSHLRWPKVA
jgi:hypothetical protein